MAEERQGPDSGHRPEAEGDTQSRSAARRRRRRGGRRRRSDARQAEAPARDEQTQAQAQPDDSKKTAPPRPAADAGSPDTTRRERPRRAPARENRPREGGGGGRVTFSSGEASRERPRRGPSHRRADLPLRAYLVSQFPEFCETFILNEMRELGRRGVPFRIYSLKRCRDREVQEGARELQQTVTLYAPPLWSPAIWTAQLWVAFRNRPGWWRCLALSLSTLPRAPMTFLKTFYVFLKAPWFARRARREGIRHLHAHWATVPTTLALFISRMAALEFSFTGHAFDIFVDRSLLREKLEAARYALTCTTYNRDFLMREYPHLPESRIHVAYHGVNLELFNEAHRQDAEAPRILAVGRLCETKGFPVLIEACRLLAEQGLDFHCRIVGEGPLRGPLERAIRRAGLEDRVEIRPFLRQTELIEEYRRARLFTLPCVVAPDNDRDGLPNVVLEAMAMSLPVVSTTVSALPEAIRDGREGLLVEPDDPPALAEAITRLWERAGLRRRLGEAARRRVQRRFGLESCMRRLARLTHELSRPADRP